MLKVKTEVPTSANQGPWGFDGGDGCHWLTSQTTTLCGYKLRPGAVGLNFRPVEWRMCDKCLALVKTAIKDESALATALVPDMAPYAPLI